MAVSRIHNEKYAIWSLRLTESPKFLYLIGNRGRKQEGDVRFLTGIRNIGVSRISNENYAIWPLVMAESPKLLHSSATDM